MTGNPGNQDDKKQAPLTVEELRDQLGTDPATFAGVRVREGWAVGALLSQTKYETAVKKFLNGPTALEGDDL